MAAGALDATALREWARAAVDGLAAHADEINALNVYPVADADTGANMTFTMRSALDHALSVHPVADTAPDDVIAVTAALADGALQGARGNSGVILSQILRGLAETVARAGRPDAVAGDVVARALDHAVGLVVDAVGAAVPGTIVSVLRAAADAALAAAAGDAALAASPATVDGICAAASEAANAALERTPQQLDVLASAGVVDAGGRGLLVVLDALTCTLTGRAPARRRFEGALVAAPGASRGRRDSSEVPQDEVPQDEVPQFEVPPFEVMYTLDLDDTAVESTTVETLRKRLATLGDSVVIAAARTAHRFSVHVHAEDAGAAVEAALDLGTPSGIQITALTVGSATRERPVARAVLAVVDGAGARELFAGEGAAVLSADDDRPVSAQRLLTAVADIGAGQVMVLPNGFVAAEELVAGCAAASARGIDVVPVPSSSMVAGLAALAVHDPERPAVDDGYAMARAAAEVRHGSVRVADEDALTWAGACRRGDGLGIAGGEVLIVRSDVLAAAKGLIDLLLTSGGELITVLTGDGVDGAAVSAALTEHVDGTHLAAELVTYHTGHRGDVLLIGVE